MATESSSAERTLGPTIEKYLHSQRAADVHKIQHVGRNVVVARLVVQTCWVKPSKVLIDRNGVYTRESCGYSWRETR